MVSSTAEKLPVLVVDDDSTLIRTLSDILRVHGYAPETADTAWQGLKLAEHRPPALAVIDLRLPDMDGMELVSRLHELSELTEVVVLTGNASVESAIEALRRHSVDYLLKPVKVEQLLHVVSVASERWQRRHTERALEARAQQQEAVARLGQRALEADDIPALLFEAIDRMTKTLGLPFGCVLERRADGASLVSRAGVAWPSMKIGETSIPVSQDSQAGFTLLRQEPAIVTDYSQDHRFPASVDLKLGVASGVTVVIPGPTNPYGVLGAYDSRAREFTRDDVHFLQAIAHIIGSAIEKQRSETAFRQAQRLEAVGRLAGGVAHDFNNMLTAITGYGEMVRMNLAENDPSRSDVEEILKAAERAAGLTRQLLAFSRQQVLQPQLVNLNDVVSGLEKMLRRLIGEDMEFVTHFESDLGWAKADPGQIEQVILNLVVNARDAMPDGGTLTIETSNVELDRKKTRDHSVETPGPYVMLAVTDTGIGMDAETKARIYEPFFSTKPADKGTGLGLATVYGIVKQSGGEIWVYSEPGQGTTFKVFLPHAGAMLDAERTNGTRPAIEGGMETVLLAEDEDSVRRLAQRVLEQAGYKVLVARNGTEAESVSAHHEGIIHLLVTDMVMPVMNGRMLAERLRARRPDLNVLYLSGYTDSIVTRKGFLPGGEPFLQKPFSNETLTRKVREALDKPLPGRPAKH